MRVLARVVVGTFVSVVLGVSGLAQTTVPCTPGLNAPSQNFLGLASQTAKDSLPKFAHTATVKTTFEQRLIDGNIISGEFTAHQAQNAAGWLHQEFASGCSLNAEGKPQTNIQVTVSKTNPVETMHWTEGNPYQTKEVTVSRPVEMSPEQKADRLAQAKVNSAIRTAIKEEKRDIKTESLGSSFIAGQAVTGTRTTETITPGKEGNSMPLTVMSETWTTRDHIMMRWINDDPRRGKTTMEVSEFRTEEPDASLFAPPEGYKLREARPNP